MRLVTDRRSKSGFGVTVFAAMVLALVACVKSAAAQENNSDWEFYTSPNIWATGVGIETNMFGPLPPTNIDVDFSEILDHLNFALENTFEVRKGRVIGLFDFNYFDLSVEQNLSGAMFTKADADMKMILASTSIGYRIVDDDPIDFDVFAGAQIVWMDTDTTVSGMGTVSISDGDTLIDPIVGIRTRIDLGSGFFLNGIGMIGGFGASSKLTWQLFGAIGWQANDWLALQAGYRHWKIDLKGGDLVDETEMTGPIIGATFRL